jgi:hypothetical protein
LKDIQSGEEKMKTSQKILLMKLADVGWTIRGEDSAMTA